MLVGRVIPLLFAALWLWPTELYAQSEVPTEAYSQSTPLDQAGQPGSDDSLDLPIIIQTTNQVLETQKTGVAIRWLNAETGHSGTVQVTGTYYLENGTPCRDYRRTVETAAADTRVIKGTGCRTGKGVWQLSETELDVPRQAASSPTNTGVKAQSGEAIAQSTQQLVLATQRLLVQLGYEPGPIDGMIGDRTSRAIRAYQEANGLRPDGKPTTELLAQLGKAVATRKAMAPAVPEEATFVALPIPAAAEEPKPAVATLTYSEKVTEKGEKTKVVCEGGGLVGAINCVTIRMENEGKTTGGREIMAQASLVLTLTPRLEVLPDDTHIVTIEADNAGPAIIGEMKEESTRLVRQDASLVKERLRAWRLSLNAESIAKIRGGEAVTVPVTRPFEGLAKLVLMGPVELTVPPGQATDPKIVKIYFSTPDAPYEPTEELAVGRSFRVIVVFDRDPGRASEPVTVTNRRSGASIRAVARRTRDAKVFRTPPLRVEWEVTL